MTTPGKRFQLVPGTMAYGFPDRKGLGHYGLMIVDYSWWVDNERHILNWMVDNLPCGIEHQQGATISFDTDYDRINFLMRWGP